MHYNNAKFECETPKFRRYKIKYLLNGEPKEIVIYAHNRTKLMSYMNFNSHDEILMIECAGIEYFDYHNIEDYKVVSGTLVFDIEEEQEEEN